MAAIIPKRSENSLSVPSSTALSLDRSPLDGRGSLMLSGAPLRDLELVRIASTRPASTGLRRLLFVWLRIFVSERNSAGDWERVDLRIPLPIPIIGAMLQRKLDHQRALRALASLEDDPSGAALSRQLDAFTGFEFIRVEEQASRKGKSSLVVIGID
jgi:hypothetical protein